MQYQTLPLGRGTFGQRQCLPRPCTIMLGTASRRAAAAFPCASKLLRVGSDSVNGFASSSKKGRNAARASAAATTVEGGMQASWILLRSVWRMDALLMCGAWICKLAAGSLHSMAGVAAPQAFAPSHGSCQRTLHRSVYLIHSASSLQLATALGAICLFPQFAAAWQPKNSCLLQPQSCERHSNALHLSAVLGL